MAGVILTLLEQADTTFGLLTASACLAELMGGSSVNALVARMSPEAGIMPTEEVLTDRRAAEIRDSEQRRATAVRREYDRWVSRTSVESHWHDEEGLPDLVLKEHGARCDVIVLAQDRSRSGQEVRTALFETDRPVLIVPPDSRVPFGHCVAIAWHPDPPATRAVLSALRCRVRSGNVHVLAGMAEGAPPPALPEVLAEHGVKATLHVLPIGGTFGETLLAKAHELGADLLVMGAYQHSPLREFFLGGVTRFMLGNADLPILMRH